FGRIKDTLRDFQDAAALPVAIDIQWDHGSPLIQGEQGCKDVVAIRRALHELEGMLRTAYGKRPVLHGYTATFAELADADFIVNPVWLQDFRKTKGQPGPALRGNNAWSIWQYTSRAI